MMCGNLESGRAQWTCWRGCGASVMLLTLNRLSRAQRADMISGVIGGKALPKEIADQIIERTDGVPLFIEELTKSVVESDAAGFVACET
jgi:predicted ATPase